MAETEVSSFQATVARMLVDIGADVGVAFGEHENETRVSIRTSQRFDSETHIDIGALLSKISQEMGMTGGGHPSAASISGNASASKVIERIVDELKTMLP